MNRLLILQGIGLLFLVGCMNTSRKNILKTYLTNDSCKSWSVYLKTPSKPFGIGYCIYTNGAFQRYIINDSSERILSDALMTANPVWEILNDSTIEFGEGIKCKILYLNEDSVILQNMMATLNDTLKLYKEFDQKLKPIKKAKKQPSMGKNSFPTL